MTKDALTKLLSIIQLQITDYEQYFENPDNKMMFKEYPKNEEKSQIAKEWFERLSLKNAILKDMKIDNVNYVFPSIKNLSRLNSKKMRFENLDNIKKGDILVDMSDNEKGNNSFEFIRRIGKKVYCRMCYIENEYWIEFQKTIFNEDDEE